MPGSPPPARLGVEAEGLAALARAIKQEANGKELRRDLLRAMKAEIAPAVSGAKSAAMTIPGRGAASPALRSGIARRIRAEVKLSGTQVGVRVKARKTPELRGFTNAAKSTQRPGGWRHPTFGRRDNPQDWSSQMGKPKWFDRAMNGRADEYRQGLHAVMEDAARRLASRGPFQ